MDRIAVLIPCYNEELTITKVITDFKTTLPDAVIYVYDNNSTDNSVSLATAAGAVVRHEYRQGKGNVIRRMFREIDSEAYIMVDADDTYPAEAADAMVNLVLERHADMVIGDRLSSTYEAENKRRFHNFGNNLVRSSINRLFHTSIRDIMTGYRAFSYEFVKRDRPEGSESKLNTIPDGIKVLRTIVKLYRSYRPLRFFGIIAAILAALSVIFFIPVWMDYMRTGLVARFPTLIVCGIVMVVALLMFVSGVILSTLRDKDRRDFEFMLVQADWMKKRR